MSTNDSGGFSLEILGQSGYRISGLLHPQTGGAFAVGKRKNSHQSAVFGEAGNGTVVGISELAAGEGFEPSHTESESAVLPLHKPAVSARLSEQILLYRKEMLCQGIFSIFWKRVSKIYEFLPPPKNPRKKPPFSRRSGLASLRRSRASAASWNPWPAAARYSSRALVRSLGTPLPFS